MTKSPKEKHSPFLFLNEFNEGTKRDLQDLNFYACLPTVEVHLIIITSKKTIADNNIMELNAWGKMRPDDIVRSEFLWRLIQYSRANVLILVSRKWDSTV